MNLTSFLRRGLTILALGLLASGCDTHRNAYALTSTGQIVKFSTTEPTAIDNNVNVSGLDTGESLVQLAFRPATSAYYGVTSDNRVGTVDPETGAVSIISTTPFTTDNLSSVAIAFDPVNDQLRVTANSTASSTTRENLRVDPDDGSLLNRSTDLFYDTDNTTHPQISGLAYSNAGGGSRTTLFGFDSTAQRFVRIGDEDSASVTAADGGETVIIGDPGVRFGSSLGLAISPQDDAAYAVLSPTGSGASLYTVDIETGAATLVGAVHERDYTLLSLVISPVEEDDD